MPVRRFPPPWTAEEYNDACFIVRDNDGQQLPTAISRMSRAGDQRPATAATGTGLGGFRKEDTIISACIARNGYIQAAINRPH